MDDSAKAGLALNDHVTVRPSFDKEQEANDKSDWVNIVRNNNESCLFGFYESGDTIKAVHREDGFLRVLG